MKTMITTSLAAALILAGSTLAMAQGTTTGTPSQTPVSGAGVGGAGAPAAGPSSNQPPSTAQPNPAVTPGPSTTTGGAMSKPMAAPMSK